MISLHTIDYVFIFTFFAITLGIGFYISKKSGKNTDEFFLSGKNMPWWLLGFSMVATTFATDTPNLVTQLVREDGVSGNWAWWIFLITGLLTVFVYAKLWRKSNVHTDIEFYSLRYGGKPANFLRGFRSLYLGVVFNVLAMSGVTLAAIKIGQVMLGLSPIQTIGIASVVTVLFSMLGGFKGVVYTDFLLFFVAMVGSIGAAYYCVNLPEVGGISNLISHPNVVGKIDILPEIDNTEAFIGLLIIPLAVQWWSAWYPGSEPGGGGYIAQRMLAAKNENHAIGATFFFNILHYALRPWPWILVALASLVIFPDVQSIHEAFPNVADDKLGHDLAYSAMLTKLPYGLMGVVLTSLIAAYMSTISTHLNWGSSYIVYDFYKETIKPNASEKELVFIGRISTLILMILSAGIALLLNHADQIFDFIIMFGAGTGLIFILRWFWWRINAWSEITAMFASGIISILFHIDSVQQFLFSAEHGILPTWSSMPIAVFTTTFLWVLVTFLTKPESDKVLFDFYEKIQPGGNGWKTIIDKARLQNREIKNPNEKWTVPSGVLAMFLGCLVIYGSLFATGYWIYGETMLASILTILVLIFTFFLVKVWQKIKVHIL
ncbi:sodium:solute symporter family protein [Aureivirga sp. CE67]|uniref:sodium:solute symporter family protein n=1 Tax=Aureivirga sp. CE67 TaxID=1788983 RepID=UPI0018CAECD4|nr:sodium:solute symporter family protein [Aureivirga sp. CE67]